MYRMNQEQKQRSSLLFFSLLFLLLHHHQKVGSQRVKPSSRGQGELEKKRIKTLIPGCFHCKAAVFIRVRSPKNMPLKCVRSQVCTPLQIVAGCCCWLLLLLLAAAAGCCCCCCCWLLLAAAAAAAWLLLAAGCCCWLLRLLLAAAAAAAAAGCCCCWLLLQLIAGICRNKENNANYRNAPLLIQGIYDLRATCARLARKFSNLPDSFDHADDDDDDDDDESSLRHLRFTCALLARPHV